MKRLNITPEQWRCLLFIILLLFGVFIPSWWDWLNSGTVVDVFVNYDDTALEGTDVPIEGIEFDILVDTVNMGSVFSDVNGMITIYCTESGDYVLRYNYQDMFSLTLDINEAVSNSDEIELAPFTLGDLELDFVWDHDSTPYTEEIDLLKSDGIGGWDYVTTVDPDGAGCLAPIAGLTVGEWMFEGAISSFVIALSDSTPLVDITTRVAPIGIRTSLIINQKPIRIIRPETTISIINLHIFSFFSLLFVVN